MLDELTELLKSITHDPQSGFVIVVLGLCALGLLAWAMYRSRKGLSYNFSRWPLVKGFQGSGNVPQVVFDGRSISDVDVAVIILTNIGGASIQEKDYALPLRFGFGEKARVLSAKVARTDPDDTDASVTVRDSREVEMQPALLRREDSIAIEVILTCFQKFSVSGRIRGTWKILDDHKHTPPSFQICMGIFAVLAGTGLAMAVAGRLLDRDNFPYPPTLLAIAGMIVIGMGILAVILWILLTWWADWRASRL